MTWRGDRRAGGGSCGSSPLSARLRSSLPLARDLFLRRLLQCCAERGQSGDRRLGAGERARRFGRRARNRNPANQPRRCRDRQSRRAGLFHDRLRQLSRRAAERQLGQVVRRTEAGPRRSQGHGERAHRLAIVLGDQERIKFTGMPSFGLAGASDADLWSIVAFIKKSPSVTDDEYKAWTASP